MTFLILTYFPDKIYNFLTFDLPDRLLLLDGHGPGVVDAAAVLLLHLRLILPDLVDGIENLTRLALALFTHLQIEKAFFQPYYFDLMVVFSKSMLYFENFVTTLSEKNQSFQK
jgi:hypothetical protein